MMENYTTGQRIQSNIFFGIAVLLILVQVSNGLNLGLISGDLKRISSPLNIKKTSHFSPVTINIKSGIPKLSSTIPPVLISKLNKKPSPVITKKKPLLPKRNCLLKFPKLPKLTKIPKLPKMPKSPLLPLIPPLLPPLIPKLPLLPLLPILPPLPLLPPILSRLSKLFKPIRIPFIRKPGLTALGSEIRPVKVPVPDFKRHILKKLLKLRKDGSLTTPEFIRFKKLLLS